MPPLFDIQHTAGYDIGEGIARRRAAAGRCEPLASGRRDPLAAPSRDRWTSARTLHVEVGKRTAWLYGGKAKQLLEHAGVTRSMWDHLRRVWMIPIDRADDVMAYAEWREHRFVTVEAVDR